MSEAENRRAEGHGGNRNVEPLSENTTSSDVTLAIKKAMDDAGQLVEAQTREAVERLEQKIQEAVKRAADQLKVEISALMKEK